MRLVVALLAAALALTGCGGGAEPGASDEATLVLDFSPNAVHTGIYAAVDNGWFADEGVDLEVRAPGETSDAPKLLAAGRVNFAVIDINDLGTATRRGFDIVPIGALVQVPLASVIAADRSEIERPRDLEGETVGVTGLPSDDAVLDAIVSADGGDPAEVERATIGFDSVAALSSGELNAATAFWNAEGVQLRELGVPTREFRAAEATAPYPELVLVTTSEVVSQDPDLVDAVKAAFVRGYELAANEPESALESLLSQVEGLDAEVQRAQLDALSAAGAFADGAPPGVVEPERYENWVRFAKANGIPTPAQSPLPDGR